MTNNHPYSSLCLAPQNISSDCQNADTGGVSVQVQLGSAVHVPQEQLELRRQLFAHDVCNTVRRVRGEPCD